MRTQRSIRPSLSKSPAATEIGDLMSREAGVGDEFRAAAVELNAGGGPDEQVGLAGAGAVDGEHAGGGAERLIVEGGVARQLGVAGWRGGS